ncbi:MAG: DUF4349 domain-containing protein [archaeon]|nr:DUF4349 domain-containing protein [archaeon]
MALKSEEFSNKSQLSKDTSSKSKEENSWTQKKSIKKRFLLEDQWKTIKNNWLLIAVVLLLVLLPSFFTTSGSFQKALMADSFQGGIMGMVESAPAIRYYGEDFAPGVEERKITKYGSIDVEIKRGDFKDKETRMKDVVKSTNSILTSENVQKYGDDGSFVGYYTIKVEADKYNAIIGQLRDLGEVTSFSENAEDITGSFVRLEDELSAERARLQRYQQLFSEVKDVGEKIQLSDRIFEQERIIKSLEEAIKNVDRRVEYTTISLTIHEKESKYQNIILAGLSDLVRKFVDSLNSVLYLLVAVIPYAILGLLGWLAVKFFRRRR